MSQDRRESLSLLLVLSLVFWGGKSLQMLLQFPKGPMTATQRGQRQAQTSASLELWEHSAKNNKSGVGTSCLLQFLFSWESHFYFIIIIIII